MRRRFQEWPAPWWRQWRSRTGGLTSPSRRGRTRTPPRPLGPREVLTTAVEHGPVLPLQFGLAFRGRRSRGHRPAGAARCKELEKLLRELDGKVELSVKAFYLAEAILGEIVRENRRIVRPPRRDALRARGGDVRSPDRAGRARGGGAARARAARCDRNPRTPAAPRPRRSNWTPSRSTSTRCSGGACSSSSASVSPEFDEAMNDAARREDGRIRFKHAGPLPPHSFVSLPWAS